jgi:hypothetical protein
MIVSSLETRVTNRKQELIAEIVELKLGSRLHAVETIDKLKARLSDLAIILDARVDLGAMSGRVLASSVAQQSIGCDSWHGVGALPRIATVACSSRGWR